MIVAKDVSAIHVLKSQLQLTEDDYRALLRQLTGKSSCKEMDARQLAGVRSHLAGLADRMGVGKTRKRPFTRDQFEKAKNAALPKERKVWALWNQLARDGLITNASPQALNAWISRQVAVSALSFCNDKQLDALIEALKAWHERTP